MSPFKIKLIKFLIWFIVIASTLGTLSSSFYPSFDIISAIASLVPILVLSIYLFVTHKKLKKVQNDLTNQINKYEQESKQLEKQISILEADNTSLSKYKGILDAEKEVNELIKSSNIKAKNIIDSANRLMEESQQKSAEITQNAINSLNQAKLEAEDLITQAKQRAKEFKDEGIARFDSAIIQSKKIIDDANKRAQEIAGSAYDAMKNAELYEKTVKAMKNIIEGYGDQYIIPERSLLDDLAEEFGFNQAGEELKKAREKTKSMIRNGIAATCDMLNITGAILLLNL